MEQPGSALDVFAAVAAPTRREILAMLASGEQPVMDLAAAFPMSMSAVSQHLSVLRSAGLVNIRKSGKQRIYSLNAEPLAEVSEWVQRYEPFWKDRMQRLGRYLEEKHEGSDRS